LRLALGLVLVLWLLWGFIAGYFEDRRNERE
jgi:nitrogen fixation-related uncharacterized protein